MATLTLEEVRGLGDPQKAYKWSVTMPAIGSNDDSLLSSGKKFTGGQQTALDSQSVLRGISSISNGNLSVNKTRFGKFNPSNYVEEVQGLTFHRSFPEPFYEGGRNTYFPGIEDIAPITIVFYQDESGRIPKYFLDWKRLVTNENGTKNYSDKYKRPIGIKLLNHLNVPVVEFSLIGCFPTETHPINLGHASERLVWTQEFSVDYMEVINLEASKNFSSTVEGKLKQQIPADLNDLADFVNGIKPNIIK